MQKNVLNTFFLLATALTLGVTGLELTGCERHGAEGSINPKNIEVFFSPKGGCTEGAVNAIEHAQKSILVQAYSFTSEPIAEALLKAKQRGVDVAILLDKSQKGEKACPGAALQQGGVPILLDCQHKIAHNKIMIIDSNKILTGSFNFTKSAEFGNAENLIILSDVPELAEIYTKNWKLHMAHSEQFQFSEGRELNNNKGFQENNEHREHKSGGERLGEETGRFLIKKVLHNGY